MHDHARRLVDDDEIGVLVEDRQRQRLGLRRGSTGSGNRRTIVWPALTG